MTTTTPRLFFIIITIMYILSLFSCEPLFYTTLVPHSAEPVYERSVGSDTIEIIGMGDFGSGTENQVAVASWMKMYKQNNPIEFAIIVGDNFYEYGVKSIDDPLFQTRFEDIYNENLSETLFYPVLGNHDYRGNVEAQILYTEKSTHWEMPLLYYNYVYYLADQTKIEFFAIDSNIIVDDNPLAIEQKEWLDITLSLSDADWKIVYLHHPLYSNGDHGDTGVLIEELQPLFELYGVNLCISGHDHDLEVIKPLNEIHYFVSGAAGKTRSISAGDNTLYAKATYGFMTFKINNSSIRVSVIIENAFVDYQMTIYR